MNFDEFIAAREQQTVNNLQFNAHIKNAKVMESTKWEELPAEEAINNALNDMNNAKTDVLSSSCWYFTKDIFEKMYEILNYTTNVAPNGVQAFVIPEKAMIVFFRNKESMLRNMSNLSPYIIEKSMLNIAETEMTDNAVIFKYYNKTVHKEFDTGVERWKLDDNKEEQ